MTVVSLQDKLNQAGSPVRMLRESQMGPYVYPIPAEFSNWRDEQLACVLMAPALLEAQLIDVEADR